MPISPRSHIVQLQGCYHGSMDPAEMEALGLHPQGIVDFSASCNPLGPSPRVRVALEGIPLERYPDRSGAQLRRELSELHGLPLDRIALGNGSVELIWSACLAYLGAGDVALIAGPTFGEYEAAARVAGAVVLTCRAEESESFAVDVNRVIPAARETRPRLLFICNPNNPTGLYLERSFIERLLFECADSLVVIDEAYLSFVECADSLLDLIEGCNLVLLRSMTKDYALAGLRLGYAIAKPPIIAALDKVRPPWSVNALAQAAGIASLLDPEHLGRSRAEVFRARGILADGLRELGLAPVPSRANFLLVDVGGGSGFRVRLLREGFCVRDCASFGLPSYVRIAVRTVDECLRLLSAIRKVLQG